MRARPYREIALIVFAAALVASCGGSEPAVLDGTWTLTSLNGSAPVTGTKVTLAFADGQVAGASGCNQYSGGHTQEGGDLTIGPLASTRMACPDPIMTQEAAYLAALQAATSYSVDGDTLELTSTEGTLTFVAG